MDTLPDRTGAEQSSLRGDELQDLRGGEAIGSGHACRIGLRGEPPRGLERDSDRKSVV
jgi:hypothetical protein